jgi:hypothetical protein
MPFSSPHFDDILCSWIRSNISLTGRLLDVGAGAGKFRDLLPDYEMDAVESWEPYLAEFQLEGRYGRVWSMTIQEFLEDHQSWDIVDWACVILGDVLEHLSVVDSKKVIHKLYQSRVPFVIKVPFLYAQIITPELVAAYPMIAGNALENHLQPDLTYEVMQQRYPQLKPLVTDTSFGVYVRA